MSGGLVPASPSVHPLHPQTPQHLHALAEVHLPHLAPSPWLLRGVILHGWSEQALAQLEGLCGHFRALILRKGPRVSLMLGTVDAMARLADQLPPELPQRSVLVSALKPVVPHAAVSLPRGRFSLEGRAKVMAILNVTPDSFYDGGRYSALDAAVLRAEQAQAEGADILDIGGESTRPGADLVSEAEELERVIPIVKALVQRLKIPISVDTLRARVAEQALELGAELINDVSGLTADANMARVAERFRAGVVVMHMRGTPRTMQQLTQYDSLMGDIYTQLALRLTWAEAQGISRDRILLDPGIGFAKSPEDNLVILRECGMLQELGCPVLIGASRKSFLQRVFGWSPDERLQGSVAAAVLAVERGARVVRVHDVRETVQALEVAHALQNAIGCKQLDLDELG